MWAVESGVGLVEVVILSGGWVREHYDEVEWSATIDHPPAKHREANILSEGDEARLQWSTSTSVGRDLRGSNWSDIIQSSSPSRVFFPHPKSTLISIH